MSNLASYFQCVYMGTGGDSLLHFLLPLAIGACYTSDEVTSSKMFLLVYVTQIHSIRQGASFWLLSGQFQFCLWIHLRQLWRSMISHQKVHLMIRCSDFFNPFKELAKCGSATVSSPHHLLTISTGSGFAAWVGCKEVLALYYSISLHLAQPSHILLEVNKKELAPPSALCVEFSQEHI